MKNASFVKIIAAFLLIFGCFMIVGHHITNQKIQTQVDKKLEKFKKELKCEWENIDGLFDDSEQIFIEDFVTPETKTDITK